MQQCELLCNSGSPRSLSSPNSKSEGHGVIDGKGRRILVVDDEPILRSLVSEKLNDFGYEAWSASGALEAKKMVSLKDPDALIVDIDLGPGPTGLELVQAFGRKWPHLGFLLLSNFSPSKWDMSVAKNVGYVRKKDVTNFQVLTTGLEEVLLNQPRDQRYFQVAPEDRLASLSRHQIEVLGMVAKGLSNGQIASLKGVTTGAVEQTMKRIYSALGLESQSNMGKRVSATSAYLEARGSQGTKRG